MNILDGLLGNSSEAKIIKQKFQKMYVCKINEMSTKRRKLNRSTFQEEPRNISELDNHQSTSYEKIKAISMITVNHQKQSNSSLPMLPTVNSRNPTLRLNNTRYNKSVDLNLSDHSSRRRHQEVCLLNSN